MDYGKTENIKCDSNFMNRSWSAVISSYCNAKVYPHLLPILPTSSWYIWAELTLAY